MNLEKLAAVDPEINAAICEELGWQAEPASALF